MPSEFTKISRYSNLSENIIVIEMKIDEFRINKDGSLRSESFNVTDSEVCCLNFYTVARCFVLRLVNYHSKKWLRRFLIILLDGDGVCRHYQVATADALKHSHGSNDLLNAPNVSFESLKYPLYITCHLETQNIEKSANLEVELQCLQKLSVDFTKILDQSIGADVALQVDGVTINANKMILCARSPVFNKMFEHNTSENAKKEISIGDIRAPVVKELVSYLYSGTKKSRDFDDVYDLYYAADKYEVLCLRNACREDLVNQLQVSNACQLLSLARRHGDESFENEVMKFIKVNFKTIVNTESFGELVKNDTDIALSLLRRINTD